MAMFANAKKLSTPKKSAKKDMPEHEIEGIRDSAAIDVVIKALTGLKTTIDADIKSAAKVIFVTEGFRSKSQPENFKGTDQGTFGVCQLKKRASSSALTSEEAALLKEHNISTTVISSEVETFVINPAYKDDQVLLAKVEKKLKSIADLPDDFILAQKGTDRTVTTDSSIAEVFALSDHEKKNVALIEKLLAIVTTPSLSPNFGDGKIEDAYKIVEELLGVKREVVVTVPEPAEAPKVVKVAKPMFGKKAA